MIKPCVRFQMRDCRARGGEHRACVQVHDRVVVFIAHFGDRHAAEHEPGIVDQPVQAAEAVAASSTTRVLCSQRGNVAADQHHRAACIVDLLGDRLGRVGARIVVERHMRALRRKCPGQRRADAGRGAGDENRLSGKVGDGQAGASAGMDVDPSWEWAAELCPSARAIGNGRSRGRQLGRSRRYCFLSFDRNRRHIRDHSASRCS